MNKDNASGGIPVLGIPQQIKGKEHVYGIKQSAIVGRVYQVKCPECGGTVILQPTEAKPMLTRCIYCKAAIVSTAETKESAARTTEAAPEAEPREGATPQDAPKQDSSARRPPTVKVKLPKGLEGKAKLVWGGFFNRKKYILHKGENIIGRLDADKPSDLMFDDEYMSRRSVKIEMLKASKGHFYKLTVLKNANPVMVNGEELNEGDSVYVNYGDTIAMGYNTFLTFKRE